MTTASPPIVRPHGEPLRVAIDARYWRSSIQTGVERYLHLLLEALATAGGRIDVGLVLTSREAAAFPAGRYRTLRLHLLEVADRRAATLDRVLRDFAPALVHFPFDLPDRLAFPSVFTLHDAGRYLFPHLMVRRVREEQNDRLLRALRHDLLRAIVTVSDASRVDIESVFGVGPPPVIVVPNFIPSDFARLLRRARGATAAREPYLLAVGVYIPTKNVPCLCRAFRHARRLEPSVVPPRLLLAGRIGWERGFPLHGRRDIVTLGHVGDDRLAKLYAGAFAFVFPSLYEGFGMPVLEALLAGTRVLCSEIPVFREIGGDLVRFADPHDEDKLARAIVERCLVAAPPSEEVEARLGRYTPARAGEALLDVYRTAAGGGLTPPARSPTAADRAGPAGFQATARSR